MQITVVPVGKIDAAELEPVLGRVAKAIRGPVELRGSIPVPAGIQDPVRRQFRASTLMNALRSRLPQLSPGRLIGAEGDGGQASAARDSAVIFVTDVDMFTANSDGVFAAFNRQSRLGVVSVRRLREAFYRRKADQSRQRSRLVREIARAAARLHGTKECQDPKCLLSSSRMVADLDLKDERFCRACSQHLFEGRIRI